MDKTELIAHLRTDGLLKPLQAERLIIALETGLTEPQIKRLCSRHAGIMQRCYNERHPGYERYGGRGITVAEEFKDRWVFIRHVVSLPGFDLALSIDRINNERGYEPGNLRWASDREQANNRRPKSAHRSRLVSGAVYHGFKFLGAERRNTFGNILAEVECVTCHTIQEKHRSRLLSEKCPRCQVCFNEWQKQAHPRSRQTGKLGPRVDVKTGEVWRGFEVLPGRRSTKDGIAVEVRCLTCTTVQWRPRAKLVKGTCGVCLTCYNQAQIAAARKAA